MSTFDFSNHSHRRYNPLTRSWVLCSPHRAKRPWQGQVESSQADERPAYDPKCYLCPGNTRVGGHPNPKYDTTFVFENDFPAVKSEQPEYQPNCSSDSLEACLLKASSTRGDCKVICFHPHHNLTVAQMTTEQILPVVETWTSVYQSFLQNPIVDYVVIFENKGEVMGCSNPHPHGQVWATEQIPEEPSKEMASLVAYKKEHGEDRCMLCDYARLEVEKKVRVVCMNDSFLCVVPWWAVWPYETMILARTHIKSLLECTPKQKLDLADILRRTACRYDNVFECSFPYSMGIHQAPCYAEESLTAERRTEQDAFHFHMHFYPPLLRSATVKKFLVGFEMLGTPQRDLTSEQAAAKLSSMSEMHFSEGK